MKISKKIDEFRIYVEDDDRNYISTGSMTKEKDIGIPIICRICLKGNLQDVNFTMDVSIKQLKILANLFNEVVKQLEQ